MNLEIGTTVLHTQTGKKGSVANLNKGHIEIVFTEYNHSFNGEKNQITPIKKVTIFEYPKAFENGVLDLIPLRSDKIYYTYDEFCYVIGMKRTTRTIFGGSNQRVQFDVINMRTIRTIIKCKSWNLKQWTKIGDWKATNLNEQIIIFPYEYKVMLDQHMYNVAFTTQENFDKIDTDKFDLHQICRIGMVDDFRQAQRLLSDFLGYKKENIFEIDNFPERVYTGLGDL